MTRVQGAHHLSRLALRTAGLLCTLKKPTESNAGWNAVYLT